MFNLISSVWTNVKTAVTTVFNATKSCVEETTVKVVKVARRLAKRVKAAWRLVKLLPTAIYAALTAVVNTLSSTVAELEPTTTTGKVFKHCTQLMVYLVGCIATAAFIVVPLYVADVAYEAILGFVFSAVPTAVFTAMFATPAGALLFIAALVVAKVTALFLVARFSIATMSDYVGGAKLKFIGNAEESIDAGIAFAKRTPEAIAAIWASVCSFGTRLKDRAIDATIDASVRFGLTALKRVLVRGGKVGVGALAV